MRAWTTWVAHCNRQVDARPLRLVLTLLAVCVLGDLAHMAWSGALDAVVYERAVGGVVLRGDPWYAFRGVAWAGPGLVITLAAASVCIATRQWTRAAIVVALLAYSQLGHLCDPGDRGIDRLLRTALLVFLFSAVPADRERVAQWPATVLRGLLVLVYLQAGFAKVGHTAQWWAMSGIPELYTILADPLAGRLEPTTWWGLWWPFRVGGVATLLVEISAPLILTRWRGAWALVAMWIHLGIAVTMHLGMFSYGMLAFYPLLFDRWWPGVTEPAGDGGQ
ncbi:MAG: hypothetical protein ACI9K2_007339 [Myxococcota bacterium]